MTKIKINKNDITLSQEMHQTFNLIAKDAKKIYGIPEVDVLEKGSVTTYTLNKDIPKVCYFLVPESYKNSIKIIRKINFYKKLYPNKIKLDTIADFSILRIGIDIKENNYSIRVFTFHMETGKHLLNLVKEASSLLDLDKTTELLALNLKVEERRMKEAKKNASYIKKALRWTMPIVEEKEVINND